MYYDKDHSWALVTGSGNTARRARPSVRTSSLHFSIDSSVAASDRISDIIITDFASNSISDSLGGLLAGARVTLDLPLIGEREAEIRWIADNRAGCRLITPLEDEELRDAIYESTAIAEYFPGLRGHGSPALMH